ncbi:hypothetical protein GCM10023176_04810 [Micromonospora coerulea]|uniref:HTH luxR-type domain-containing protein n=1 Tax=Micromonospora coerulea TaxID=47856 RepID=A0ABP8S7S4_9ACTN
MVLTVGADQMRTHAARPGQRGMAAGQQIHDRILSSEAPATLRAIHQRSGGTAPTAHLLPRARDPLTAPSAREREVLALLAEGHSNAAVAAKLTSPKRQSASTSATSGVWRPRLARVAPPPTVGSGVGTSDGAPGNAMS